MPLEFTYMCVPCDVLFLLNIMFLRVSHVDAHSCSSFVFTAV